MTPKTSYETPPGPNADHWRAWCDRRGADCSPYGQGMTEAEAIADLDRQIEEAGTSLNDRSGSAEIAARTLAARAEDAARHTRTHDPNRRKSPMKTCDEAIRDLAGRAEEQCEALAEKMIAVIDEIDDEGDPEYDTLRGIAKDSDGRAMLVFKPDGSTARTPRYVVYVDAILALSKLLNGEVQVRDE